MNAHVIDGRSVEDMLIEASDSVLGEAETVRLRAHLVGCASCASLAGQHEKLAQRLHASVPYSTAQLASLARVREAGLRRRTALWPWLATAAVALAVVVGSVGISEVVGRFQIPERVTVAESSQTLGDAVVALRVEEGRFAAAPGQTSGVLASADLRLATPVGGSAELRFAMKGEPYGVLAAAPDLRGVTRLHLENGFPAVASAAVVDIWLHIEGPEPRDSDHIVVRIESSHGGLRARAIAP